MSRAAPLTEAQLAAIRAAQAPRLRRAKRRRKLWAYRFHAGLGFVVAALVRALPLDAVSGLADWLGKRFSPQRAGNARMRRTMRVAFPDLDDIGADALAGESSGVVLRVLVELVHLSAFAGRDNPRLRLTGLEHIEAARAGGRGVLVVAGHVSNWELPEVAMRNAGLDGVIAVMPPTNPYVYGWITKRRMRYGLSEQAGAGEGVYRACRRQLRAGNAALLLADQHVGHGVKAPFFGLETMTNVLPARLARTLGVAVVPLAIRRKLGRRVVFDAIFLEPMEFVSTGDNEADEKAFTARMNTFYESEVRNSPGQWLWTHPRWDDVLPPLSREPQP